MVSFQSENIVKTDFFLPSFHQEVVTVDQEDHAKDHNDNFTGGYDHSHFRGMENGLIQCRTIAQKFHHVDHGNAEDTGDHIRNVSAFIITDVLNSQFGKNSFTHDIHRLSSVW